MLPDGRKQCPFCYTIFDKDNNPINGEQVPDGTNTKLATRAEVPKPLKKDKKEENNKETGSKITEQGVVSNIGKFNEGTAALIKDEKFKQNFLLDYKPVQKQVQKQMGMIDK